MKTNTRNITIGIMAIMLVANIAQAVINNPADVLWEGTMNITDGERLNYSVSGDYTWTLNEDESGNPADVTYSGSDGLCILGYSTLVPPITVTLTIRTTVGDPGVINYIGKSDLTLGIRIGHAVDSGIINIENGNTLMVHNILAHKDVPLGQAVININDGQVFCYGNVQYKNMSGIIANIGLNGSVRIVADIANVFDQASYTAYTIGDINSGGVDHAPGGVVNAPLGGSLVFADGGDYEGEPTVLITAVPEPATLMLLSLGGLALLRNRKR